jgi:hypothetical protein
MRLAVIPAGLVSPQEVKFHGGYRDFLALQGAELMRLKVQETLAKAQTL